MTAYQLLAELDSSLPHFPDGRIDYTHSRCAMAVNVVICCHGRVLLLKRSQQVLAYKGMWNVVGGYWDELVSVEEKVYEELWEELRIRKDKVSALAVGRTRKVQDRVLKKTWYVVPVLASLKARPRIVLDFEHTAFAWVSPEELCKFNVIPKVGRLVSRLFVRNQKNRH